jgi:DNA-binding response OmpR family regulator
MHVRRILLIDDDLDFQQLLEQRLGPYGFQIVRPVDASNPLGHVKDVRPAIIVISVELPDKVGYALCNKAKKGLAREIPVILTTRSVPASGFRSHRKLKVHADEYIDKRSMTEEEVVAKVDHLVGLAGMAVLSAQAGTETPGAQASDVDDLEELDMADLVEEASLASAQVAEAGARVADDSSAVPEQIAHEGGVEFDPRELGADEDDDGSFAFSEPVHVGNEVVVPLSPFGDGRAAPAPAHSPDTTHAETDPRLAGPDLSELNEFESDRTAVVAPFPLPFDSPAARLEVAEPVAASAESPSGPVPQIETDGGVEPSAPVADLDLGLEQVASLAEEEQSDVRERPEADGRMLELEKEVARLRAELEQPRQQPAAASSPFSREREFLNLREVINKKEKLILDLNDQLDDKDRLILSTKDRVRELDRIRADLDAKNLELEQSLLGANEELADLRAERASLAETLDKQAEAGTSARADADRLSRTLESERAQWRDERDSAARRHASEIDQLKQEMEASRTEAEAALRDQQASDLRSLKEAYEETSAEKDKGFGAALALAEVRRQEELSAAQRGAEERLQLELAEQRRRHQEELESIRREAAAEKDSLVQAQTDEVDRLTRQHQETRQGLEQRHADELARVHEERRQAEQTAEERANDLTAAEERRARELAEAESRRVRALDAVAEERARAEAELVDKHESDKTAMEREHAAVRGDLEERLAEREQELRERGDELARAREQLRERDGTIAAQGAQLAEKDARIATLRQEQEELERQNAGYQEQILRAFQKIKADEATVARAKKAMAIALTLLDDAEQAASVEQAVSSEE